MAAGGAFERRKKRFGELLPDIEVADVAPRVELAAPASRGELGFHLRDEVPLRPGVAHEVQWRFRHEGVAYHSP
jgi:hypothetical protein